MIIRTLDYTSKFFRKNLKRIQAVNTGGGAYPYFGLNTIFNDTADTYTFTGTNKLTFDTTISSTIFTFCAWIYTTSTNTQSIFDKNGYFASSFIDFPFALRINSSKIQLNLSSGNDFITDMQVNSTATISTNTWYHVGCTVSPTNYTVYIDGVLDLSGTPGFVISAANGRPWTLGAPPFYNGVPENSINFIGQMKYPIFAPNIYNTQLIVDAAAIS